MKSSFAFEKDLNMFDCISSHYHRNELNIHYKEKVWLRFVVVFALIHKLWALVDLSLTNLLLYVFTVENGLSVLYAAGKHYCMYD